MVGCWLGLLGGAWAAPYLVQVGGPVELGVAGAAPIVLADEAVGWFLLYEAGQDLWRVSLGADLALAGDAPEALGAGVQPCEDHRVVPCADGGWLHQCGGTLTSDDDTAWAFLYGSDWSLLVSGALEAGLETSRHGGAPLVCGTSLQATAFSPDEGTTAPLVVFDEDLSLLASPYDVPSAPGLTGALFWLQEDAGALALVVASPEDGELRVDRLDAATGEALQARHAEPVSGDDLQVPAWLGGAPLGDLQVVAHLVRDPTRRVGTDQGEVWLAVLDDRGTLLEQVQVAVADGAATSPSVALQGDTLLVAYELEGQLLGVEVEVDLVAVQSEVRGPVVRAGSDRSAEVGGPVELDGSDSYDPEGQDLEHAWRLIYQPAASALVEADLAGADTPRLTFTPLELGGYELELTVDDGAETASDTVVITVVEQLDTGLGNQEPIADAGPDRVIYLGDVATLDASASDDADGDPLSFTWRLAATPAGSDLADADLVGADAAEVSLTPDVEGAYELSLVVSDGLALANDQAQVTALTRDGTCQGCGAAPGGGGWVLWLLPALVGGRRDGPTSAAPGSPWPRSGRQR